MIFSSLQVSFVFADRFTNHQLYFAVSNMSKVIEWLKGKEQKSKEKRREERDWRMSFFYGDDTMFTS